MEIEKEVNNYPTPHAVYNGENAKNMGKKILKPIRQEKIVKVPVTQYVEKIIEKEEIKYVNKYVDVIKPIITYKTKHISKPIYLDKIKYETKILEKEKIVHIPKIEYKNKIVDIPVYVHREKIIEKKVPLIIERVVPVLKVSKNEKCVFTDTVEMPEICNMIQKEKFQKSSKVVNSSSNAHAQEENSHRISFNQHINIPSVKISNEEDPSNMKTYRISHKSDVEEMVAEKKYTTRNKQDKKFVNNSSSSASSTNDVEDAHTNEPLREKRNTEYIENVDENINSNEAAEEEVHEMGGSNVHEHIEVENASAEEEQYTHHVEEEREQGHYKHTEVEGEEEQYYNNGDNAQFNTTRVSVHLAEPVNESGIYEQKFVNVPENNNSVMFSNNQMYMNNSDVYYDNGQKYLRPNVEGNHIFSEQVINQSGLHTDPKLYSSFPVNGQYPGSIQEITKEQAELNQSYVLTNMNPITRERYNSLHNAAAQSTKVDVVTPSKQNLRPSYANSNGQTIVSVRPATIVEYKPKTRKSRPPMCNFLNKCCGGGNI